ncbi:hypothetical protein HOC80_01730 [archaeon]|jgi:organic radical activating enzyme|nr:hypothetical protein [archaeon]MBT4416801.1 hypothetical protein [archaeon]
MTPSLIKIEDGSTLLEITDRCYGNCNNYCYKAGSVGPTSLHVPIEIVNQRINWIKDYTNANMVTLIGGEPLLHPQLGDIIESIQNKGLTPGIITSVKVPSKYQHNVQLMIYLHMQGKLDVEMSYHPESNETEFLELLQQFKASAPQRTKALEQLVKDTNGDPLARRRLNNPTIFTTMTLDQQFESDPYKFIEMQRQILASIGIDISTYTIEVEGQQIPALSYFEQIASKIPAHFLPFCESETFEWSFGVKDRPFEYEITCVGRTGVEPTHIFLDNKLIKVNKILASKGSPDEESICPAMSALILKSTIEIEGLLIRTDGEMTYPEPACISRKHIFGNIDNLQDKKAIYSSFQTSIECIKQLIIATKAFRATADQELCKEDPNFPEEYLDRNDYICPTCEFDLACNICGSIEDVLENTDGMFELIENSIA